MLALFQGLDGIVRTQAPMKRGLKRRFGARSCTLSRPNPGPDEEGIETLPPVPIARYE